MLIACLLDPFIPQGERTAMVGEGGTSTWLVEEDDGAMDDDEEEEVCAGAVQVKDGDIEEEEEETMTVTGVEVGGFKRLIFHNIFVKSKKK